MNGSHLLAYAFGFWLGWFVRHRSQPAPVAYVKPQKFAETDTYRGVIRRDVVHEAEAEAAVAARRMAEIDDENRESPTHRASRR